MDFLDQIWTAWNEQWGATIAAILGIIAIAMNTGDKIHRLSTAIKRWKGWAIARRWYRSSQRKYRVHRAKNAMFAHLKQTPVRIPIRTYTNCLAENPLTSERNTLSAIIPKKPSWLNDYLVATALEALRNEEKIVKAELYQLSNHWPPNTETYLFLRPEPGKTIEEKTEEVEVESRCRVEQFQEWRHLSSCSEESRYDTTRYAETTAPGNTTFGTRVTPKPSAPPCSRCWERKSRERDIKMLVDGITKYDLASEVTIEVTGSNREFQEAITEVCIESDCATDAATVKEIVTEAITIRRSQLSSVPVDHEAEWTEQLTTDFKSSLSAHIGAAPEESPRTRNRTKSQTED